MVKWKIPLYKIFNDEDDVRIVSKVIKRGMDWAIGPEVEQFEYQLAKYVGSNYCLVFNSGTSALHAALLSLGIRGGRVLVPSFTFISTANSALMVGAKPTFVDIEEDTLGLDPSKIGRAINTSTKAIMPVHYAGLPCKIEEIKEISKKKKIPLIEDAAEALGSRIRKKMVGTFGDLSVFSFAGNKVLTTGEGGAIVTNSNKIFNKLKLIRSHGRIEKQNYFSSNIKPEYIELGFNWRMSSISAALGITQLSKMEKMINMRRKNAAYLTSRLNKYDKIKVPTEPKHYRHVYQLYSIQLPNLNKRNMLMKFLTKKGIMSKVYFNPIHQTRFYKQSGFSKTRNLQVTERIANKILSLPLYPNMKKEELKFIIDSVSEFLETK